MTDPRRRIELTSNPSPSESVSAIIRRERLMLCCRPSRQTALNLAIALADSGVLEECGVEMIGAKREAIKIAEDRMLFKQALDEGVCKCRGRLCQVMGGR